MKIIFNELSINVLPQSIQQADVAISCLFETAKELSKISRQRIRILANILFSEINLAENYHIKQWFSKLPREDRQLFVSYTAQEPLIHDYPYYYFQNQECKGFAYAYENDCLSINYNPNANWSETKYLLEKRYLDEQTLDYEVEKIEILHISKQEHLSIHQIWIEHKIKLLINEQLSEIKNHTDFWKKRDELFKQLVFCEEVEFQIASIPFNFLSNAIQKLLSMNSMIEAMPSDFFEIDKIQLNISPESESTLAQLSAERTFLCPDGERRIFNWHIKLPTLRIYFYPIPESKKCWIGYIGKHLRTTKYK